MTGFSKITPEVLRSIAYFTEEKGDPARCVCWEDALPAFRRELPDLAHTYDHMIAAKRKLEYYTRDFVQQLEEQAERLEGLQ